MNSPPDGFDNEAGSAFSFLVTDFGFSPVARGDAQLTWRSGPRYVQVTWDRMTDIHFGVDEERVALGLVLWLQRIRPDAAAMHFPHLQMLRYKADLTRQHAGPWLRGDRAAFASAREVQHLTAAWQMDAYHRDSPRPLAEKRRLERLWRLHDFAGVVATLEASGPLRPTEEQILDYARRQLS